MLVNRVLLIVVVALQIAILYGLRADVSQNRDKNKVEEQWFPQQGIQDALPGITLNLNMLPKEGQHEAKVGVVEFADYECPFCAQHATTVLNELRVRFIETGRIRYSFANFPLPMHQNAKMLATAAICAGEHGTYWAMHDQLFATRPSTEAAVVGLAADLGIDADNYRQCLSNPDSAKQIERDFQMSQELHLTGTPSFAIGIVDQAGTLTVKKIIVGAHPVSVFEAAINNVSSGE